MNILQPIDIDDDNAEAEELNDRACFDASHPNAPKEDEGGVK